MPTTYVPLDPNYQTPIDPDSATEGVTAGDTTSVTGNAQGFHLLTLPRSTSSYGSQLALSDTGQGLFYRIMEAGTWQPWSRIWTTANAPAINLALLGDPASFSDAFDTALSLAITSGLPIVAPAGTYHLTRKHTISTDKKFVIQGAGGPVILQWNCEDGGLDLTYNDRYAPPELRDVKLSTTYTGADGGGTALRITSSSTAPPQPALSQGPLLAGVTIMGGGEEAPPEGGYWTNGAYLLNCWYPKIAGCCFIGANQGGPPFATLTGVTLDTCQAPMLRDNLVFHVEDGILVVGSTWGEGFQLSGGEMVGVRRGINNATAAARSGTAITATHINAFERCVINSQNSHIEIANCLFFRSGNGYDWQGVELVNCQYVNVHDNNFACPNAGDESANGVTLNGASDCRITNNLFSYWATIGSGIVLVNASDHNKINGNSSEGGSGPSLLYAVLGSGTNNRIYDNSPTDPVPT